MSLLGLPAVEDDGGFCFLGVRAVVLFWGSAQLSGFFRSRHQFNLDDSNGVACCVEAAYHFNVLVFVLLEAVLSVELVGRIAGDFQDIFSTILHNLSGE